MHFVFVNNLLAPNTGQEWSTEYGVSKHVLQNTFNTKAKHLLHKTMLMEATKFLRDCVTNKHEQSLLMETGVFWMERSTVGTVFLKYSNSCFKEDIELYGHN